MTILCSPAQLRAYYKPPQAPAVSIVRPDYAANGVPEPRFSLLRKLRAAWAYGTRERRAAFFQLAVRRPAGGALAPATAAPGPRSFGSVRFPSPSRDAGPHRHVLPPPARPQFHFQSSIPLDQNSEFPVQARDFLDFLSFWVSAASSRARPGEQHHGRLDALFCRDGPIGGQWWVKNFGA